MIGILIALIIGAVSGFIANLIMNTEGGLVKNIIIGVVGGVVGDLLFGLIGIGSNGYIGDIVVSVLGACLLIFIAHRVIK